ncbi:hypothetical protein Vadar_016383 [Vaccinium darrowii]|uniref:Uncharacterized protein n=1 Tax=Vaccinium darrowii TaxID=229202 RepID=A0ACB7XA66_9ERIC|nr:hypothetical protein Vadar_016383 [Vaccinium darrowii]
MDNKKQTKGRQRIDTSKKRENEEKRLVTFSKRKPFSFAHPNIEVIARRVWEINPQSNENSNVVMDAYRRNKITELNEKLTIVSDEGEYEKEWGMKLAQMEKVRQNKLLCEQKIDELSDYNVPNMKDWLLELYGRINDRLEEPIAQAIGMYN